ncbi:MAG: SDR family NAD(P)-dependent oxidoreductase [Nitrososphaerota archaeon]
MTHNHDDVYKGKKILITGGTGSLGQALTKRLLNLDVNTIRIFSRNESKQIMMASKFSDKRLRFFIGDVRDFDRLTKALEDVDIVFHAAALKHVPIVEYNPFEAIKTNVIGSQNVIDACLHENVDRAVCIGTDKAVSPLNTYGATKLLMEKLFVTANNYLNKKRHRTKFIALRYGNVLGSSGSVVPTFIEQIRKKKKLTITDPKMTRFSITMDEALDFILESTMMGVGSEIFVPKLRSYSIVELKEALIELLGKTGEVITGIRSGEKLHEVLINNDELRYTWELGNKYVILQSPRVQNKEKLIYSGIRITKLMKAYSSDNVERISKNELKKIISKNILSKSSLI